MNSLGETPIQWRDNYADAAAWFVSLAAAAKSRHTESGLGEWTVRDLIGHTSRSLTTVVDYLDATGPVELHSAAGYFRAAAVVDAVRVAEHGREAGAALGTDADSILHALAERAQRTVGSAADDSLVGTPFGVMTLAEYLPTRTFELGVHGCDLAAALGLPLAAPTNVGESAGRLVAALMDDRAGEVLLALTGRRPLPSGFSALRIGDRG